MNGVLVTGGAGFIGANFCHYWTRKYPKDRLVVLDSLTYAGKRENIKELEDSGAIEFVHGDICNQSLVEGLIRSRQLDRVIHFAAESHVDRSIADPDAFIETNVVGTYHLLKAAKKVWLDEGLSAEHRFHHVSTDEVYGSLGPNDPSFTEETRYAPNSPYSASKAASDHLVRSYHHTYGLKTSQSNCSNNYGPYQDSEKLIPVIIDSVLKSEPIPIYGDGKNVRDWLYVEDHCRAIDLIIENGRAGEVYNIGGENEWTNINIVTTICDLIDNKLRADITLRDKFPCSMVNQGKASKELITFVKDRAGHDRRYAINPTKCNQILGFHPLETFESGINKTIDYAIRAYLKPILTA